MRSLVNCTKVFFPSCNKLDKFCVTKHRPKPVERKAIGKKKFSGDIRTRGMLLEKCP